MTDFTARRVFQRISGVCVITFSGTYTGGTANNVQVQIAAYVGGAVVVAWTVVDSVLTGGTWSGTLSVPEGGYYTGAARLRDSGNVVIATQANTNRWGVGDIFVFPGSSTVERFFTEDWPTAPNATISRVEANGTTWAEYIPSPGSNYEGSGAIAFLNEVQLSQPTIPCAGMHCGVGGTWLHLNATVGWSIVTDTNYAAMATGITATGGKIAGIVAGVGSGDAAQGIVTSVAAWVVHMQSLIGNIRTLCGQPSLPAIMVGTQRAPNQSTTLDIYYSRIRGVQNAISIADPLVFMGYPDVVSPLGVDNVHISTASYPQTGRYCGRSWRKNVLGDAVVWGFLTFTAMTYNSVTGVGLITAIPGGGTGGVGLTGPTGLTGLVFSDGGGVVTPVVAPQWISPTVVQVTLATGLSGVSFENLPGTLPIVTNYAGNNAVAAT